MKTGTVWSKIIGIYLLINGLFALAVTGYYGYIDSPLIHQGPLFIFILNNVLYPLASTLVGYFLLISPENYNWAMYYLLASVIGIGIDDIIYWSGHGYVLSVYLNIFGLFFAINFSALIGLAMLYQHSVLTSASNSPVNLPRFSGHLLITQEEENAQGYTTEKDVGIYNRF